MSHTSKKIQTTAVIGFIPTVTLAGLAGTVLFWPVAVVGAPLLGFFIWLVWTEPKEQV